MRRIRGSRLLRAKRQDGSIVLFAAIGISMLIALLALMDIGFLYYYKRDYQKAADMAALAGAAKLVNSDGTRSCNNNAKPAASTAATNNLGTRPYTLAVSCGTWNPSVAPSFVALASDTDLNQVAVRAIITGTPPHFLLAGTSLRATATATVNSAQAQLKIRSTLATLNDGVVNALLSNLLGGSAALSVVGWQGVANANVNLLQFLNNILGINAAVDIGTYQNLLNASNVSLGQVLDATIAAVGTGSTAGVTLQAFKSQLTTVGVNVNTLTVPLGSLLTLQTGAETAGLNAVVNAMDLVRAVVEIANKQNAIAATVPISVPGVLGVSIRASVIEKPQPSAIGNPALIGSDPRNGANRIYVRTGQIRVLVGVDLSVIGLVNQLMNILGPLLGVQLLDNKLDIALQIGGAEGWVTGYTCGADGSKSLTAQTQTAIANASVGKLTTTQEADVFSSTAGFPSASTINVLSLTLLGTTVAQVQLAAKNLPVGASSVKTFTYSATTSAPDGLPEIGTSPEPTQMYQSLSTQNIVSSLTSTIDSLQLSIQILPGLGLLTSTVNALLSGVTSLVSALVGSVLAPVLDPLLNNLLAALGLNLANADLGAELSCNGTGSVLVD